MKNLRTSFLQAYDKKGQNLLKNLTFQISSVKKEKLKTHELDFLQN